MAFFFPIVNETLKKLQDAAKKREAEKVEPQTLFPRADRPSFFPEPFLSAGQKAERLAIQAELFGQLAPLPSDLDVPTAQVQSISGSEFLSGIPVVREFQEPEFRANLVAGAARTAQRAQALEDRLIPGGTGFEAFGEAVNLPFTLVGGAFIDAFNDLKRGDIFNRPDFDISGTIERQRERGIVPRLLSESLTPFEAAGIVGGIRQVGRLVGAEVAHAAPVIKTLATGSRELLPPVANNIINLQPIPLGLSRMDRLRDLAAVTIGKPFKATRLSDIATPANAERFRVKNIIDTQGNIIGSRTRAAVSEVFDIDGKGRILSLAGIDTTLPSAPTIQDVAARLPTFLDSLTPAQLRVLRNVESEIVPYKNLFDELSIEISTRTDIIEGGFYLPRGNALKEGADDVVRIVGGRGGKKGFEKTAVFDSMAEGLDNDFTYSPLHESVEGFAKDAGNKALDEHIGNFYRTVRDDEGVLIGSTPKDRLLQQNPKLAKEKANIDRNLNRLKALLGRMTERQQLVIDDFIHNPEFDDIEALRTMLVGIKVQRGPSTGAGIRDLQTLLEEVKTEVKTLAPAWKSALKRARQTPRGEAAIDMAQLNNRTFPVEVANAANAVLRAERNLVSPAEDVARALNNLYRGLNATLDNSALGIQGLLGLADDQKAYATALKVNLRAWGRGGDETLGKFLLHFDEAADQSGRIRAIEWGKEGLRVGGQDTEFMLGTQGSLLNKIPGVRQANRAFGYFGDTLRLQWADDELEALLRQGQSIEGLRANGAVQRIASAVNGATGWAPGKTLGNMGDLLLFAPRFMQARLETVTRAVASIPADVIGGGATIDQRFARRSLLKLIGYGTLLTVAANEMLGQETDYRPIVNGRYNSNFMRIRFAGRDWSVFGTWDFIPRAIISTALGKPQDVIRSSGSGIVSGAWDLLTNETFVGEAVRDNPQQFALWLLEHLTPFAFEEIPFAVKQIGEGNFAGGFATILGESVGAKSSPLTGREATDVARKGQMEAAGETGEFEDLAPARQVEIDAVPEVAEAKTVWQEQQRRRQSEFRAYADERDKINEDSAAFIAELAKREGIGKAFRENVAVHQRDRARDQSALKMRSSEALEFLLEKEPGKAIESQALDAYATLIFDPSLEDPVTFDYNFAEREKRLAQLRQPPPDGFGDEVIDGVEDFIHRNEHPLVTELRKDRESLKPYWDIVEVFVLPKLSPREREIYTAWLDQTRGEKANIVEHPEGRVVVSKGNAMKEFYQREAKRQNPDIATLLNKWEYSVSRETRQLAGVTP